MWITFSKDDPLHEVIAQVERTFGVRLTVTDEDAAQGQAPTETPIDPGLAAQADDWSSRAWHDGGSVG